MTDPHTITCVVQGTSAGSVCFFIILSIIFGFTLGRLVG